MSEAVAAALITAGAGIFVQLIISAEARLRQEKTSAAQNAVLLHRLDCLEAKVERQNMLFERLYKAETDMAVLKDRLENYEVRC